LRPNNLWGLSANLDGLSARLFQWSGLPRANALGCPRFLSAVAEDKHLPPRIAAPHPRFQTPSLAIIITNRPDGVRGSRC